MLLPYHPDHLLQLDLTDEEDYFKPNVDSGSIRRAFYLTQLSYTYMENEKAYCCFGVVPLWPGRGMFWCIFDRNIGPNRFRKIVRIGSSMIDEFLKNGFYRIEAYVNKDYPAAIRLAELIKFEREGLMKKLDGERDFYIYARGKI